MASRARAEGRQRKKRADMEEPLLGPQLPASFHCFGRLPTELRLYIWALAIRPYHKNEIHYFSLVHCPSVQNADAKPDASAGAADGGEYALAPPRQKTIPVTVLLAYLGFWGDVPSWSWHAGNPSPYSWDLGLWGASRESREALLWCLKHAPTMRREADENRVLRAQHRGEEVTLRVRPGNDMFCLQFDDLDMTQARTLDWSKTLQSLPFWPAPFSPTNIAFEFDRSWCQGTPNFSDIQDENSARGLVVRAFVAAARGELGDAKIWLIDRSVRPFLALSRASAATFADLHYEYAEICISLSMEMSSTLDFCDWLWVWYRAQDPDWGQSQPRSWFRGTSCLGVLAYRRRIPQDKM